MGLFFLGASLEHIVKFYGGVLEEIGLPEEADFLAFLLLLELELPFQL